jgi:RNA polymerase sigma-70 factor (ECF subfamily)
MQELTDLSDGQLLGRASAGDQEAFTVLYRRCQGPVFRFALRMSGSPALAEEVTQEAFLVLIRNPERFEASRGSLAAFLFGVARHHVLRHLERDRRLVPLSEGDGGNGHVAPSDGDLDRRQRVEQVRRAVLSLPARYREVVVLCDLNEASYEDAAQAIGCGVGTVRSRLHRARALLAGKLRAAPDARRCSA